MSLFFALKVVHSNTARISAMSNIVSATPKALLPNSPPMTTGVPEYTTEDVTTPEVSTEARITSSSAATTYQDEDTTSATTPNAPEQEPELSHGSDKTQFAMTIAFGASLLLVILIAVPLIIKSVISRRAKMCKGHGDNGHYSTRRIAAHHDAQLLYSNPTANAKGSRGIERIMPHFFPASNPYQLHASNNASRSNSTPDNEYIYHNWGAMA